MALKQDHNETYKQREREQRKNRQTNKEWLKFWTTRWNSMTIQKISSQPETRTNVLKSTLKQKKWEKTTLRSGTGFTSCDRLPKEALLKGKKVQYSWPPWTKNFQDSSFLLWNYLIPLHKTSYPIEEINCSEPSPQLVFHGLALTEIATTEENITMTQNDFYINFLFSIM